METDIKQYIKERIPELNERLFPVLTTDISKLSVVYLFTDISSDHVKESQLTLNVICCWIMNGAMNRKGAE